MANDISVQLHKHQSPQAITQSKDDKVNTVVNLTPSRVKSDESKLEQENVLTTRESQDEMAEKLKEKVTQLNDQMQNLNRSLQFTVDEESGDSVVTVRDAKTDEVIRQFPSEELLRARHAIDENMKGMLIEVDV